MTKEVDTLKHGDMLSTYRTDYFLVNGDSKKVKDYIGLYIINNLDSSLLKYNQYDMKFYKESDNLNLNIINRYNQKYKAFIDEKPIIIYTWFDGKLVIHK